jgi:acyl-coenzyme A synthetase/AMP-(fatty) acid ligase
MTTVPNATSLLLDRHVDGGDGAAPCLHYGGETYSYEEVLDRVATFAGLLTRAGVTRGTPVLIALPDGPLSVAAVLGAMRAGGTAVLLSHRLKPADYRRIASDCRPAAAVLSAGLGWLAEEFDAHCWVAEGDGLESALRVAAPVDAVPVDADDVALIQYTSGSTGDPHGVMHRHPALTTAQTGVIELLDLQPHDILFSASKLAFGYGFGNSVLSPMLVGASSVLVDEPVDPPLLGAELARHRPTVLFSVPTMFSALLSAPGAADRFPLRRLRAYVSSGEHLGHALGTRLTSAFGPALTSLFGCTETLYSFAGNKPGQWSPESIGEPLRGYEFHIEDADDGVGPLLVRGPGVAAGYLNRPEKTASVFRDGWVRTGDVVKRRGDGLLTYLGRNDDVLKVGGARVAPAEIEDVLRVHADVAECAVVGVPDADGLHRLVAYVVPAGPHDDETTAKLLRRHLRTHVIAQRRPQFIEVVRELPKTSTGKVARKTLRQRASLVDSTAQGGSG